MGFAHIVSLLAVITRVASAGITRGKFLAGAAGCVAAVPLACEAYARAPSWTRDRLPPLPVDRSSETLTIVIPGAGGPDENSRRIALALQGTEYDWSPFVGDQLQAPYNAERVGEFLAAELGRERMPRLRHVHVVGVSVGAFAADKLVAALRKQNIDATLRLTLLDPFTARGLPGLVRPATAYGVRRFGWTADVAECVFNSDDPVPSTSLPLEGCVNFDITRVGERALFTPLPGDSLHSWPAAWFGMNPLALAGAGRELERGQVVALH